MHFNKTYLYNSYFSFWLLILFEVWEHKIKCRSDHIKKALFSSSFGLFLHFFSSFLNLISSFVHNNHNHNHHHLHILLHITFKPKGTFEIIAIVLIIRLNLLFDFSELRLSIWFPCLRIETISLLLIIPFYSLFFRCLAFNPTFTETMIFFFFLIYYLFKLFFLLFCQCWTPQHSIGRVCGCNLCFQWLPHEWHLKNLQFVSKVYVCAIVGCVRRR